MRTITLEFRTSDFKDILISQGVEIDTEEKDRRVSVLMEYLEEYDGEYVEFSDLGKLFEESFTISLEEFKSKSSEVWYNCNTFYSSNEQCVLFTTFI